MCAISSHEGISLTSKNDDYIDNFDFSSVSSALEMSTSDISSINKDSFSNSCEFRLEKRHEEIGGRSGLSNESQNYVIFLVDNLVEMDSLDDSYSSYCSDRDNLSLDMEHSFFDSSEELILDEKDLSPIHIAESRLLQLMTKFSIPLYSYKQFMDWSCLCQEEMYEYNQKSTFGSVMKQFTKNKSLSHNIPKSIEVQVHEATPVIIQSFPFIKTSKDYYKILM